MSRRIANSGCRPKHPFPRRLSTRAKSPARSNPLSSQSAATSAIRRARARSRCTACRTEAASMLIGSPEFSVQSVIPELYPINISIQRYFVFSSLADSGLRLSYGARVNSFLRLYIYMQAALAHLASIGLPVSEADQEHLSPLGFAHISFHRRFIFNLPEEVQKGQLRPLHTLRTTDAISFHITNLRFPREVQ